MGLFITSWRLEYKSGRSRSSRVCAFKHCLAHAGSARSSMSQVIDLSQHLHTSELSTSRDLSTSYPQGPQKEKGVVYGEAPSSSSFTSSKTVPVYYLDSQDDFPDGGLRAWLVVLGVCSRLYVCGRR